MEFSFDSERECPKCGQTFHTAEQKTEYEPVVVVVCPGCGGLLWRPGLETDAQLHPYDPSADAGGL
jgi:hypothetical protein